MWWCGGIVTKVCVVGGHDGSSMRSEIMEFDGEDWKEIGQLLQPRACHAVTMIDITTSIGFCN